MSHAVGADAARIVAELKTLLRFPTVSAQPAWAPHLVKCANWLAAHLRAIGLADAAVWRTRGHPIVLGSRRGPRGRPTILVYGHYDVQPADPLAEWHSKPFEPAVRGDHLYARGASDDKGQLFVHVKAIERLVRRPDGLPVTVKILLEGEEEMGSPHLPSFLEANRSKLGADVAVVSDTRMIAPDGPAITYGLRGSLGLELEVTGLTSDRHSGTFGGAIHNPIQGLCEILARFHDPAGRVAIPGFYDRVRPVPAREREYLARIGPTDLEMTAAAGAVGTWGERGFTAFERTTIRPAITINGVTGGYEGPGTKAIIPSRASAKLNLRLVPDQRPDEVDRQLRAFLSMIVPTTLRVRVKTQKQARPVVVSMRHPAVRAASLAYERSFGRAPVFLRSGGTIPVVDMFQRSLGLPTVLMGFGLPDDGIHGPNERLHLPTFFKAIETSERFLVEMGSPRIEWAAS